MTAQEQADAEAQAKWLRPTDDQVWKKVALFFLVMYCLWVFLLTLSLMGSGFKLLGGKDSAKMFDFVDNPVSGLMIGILATVLVQSSSTTTSIIVSLVGANELSVRNAVFMIMGANIGTSVTNTIVAMGHFANADDLRRGFSAATVHDIFNLLSVLIFLPINWIYPVFEKMTYEIAKNQKGCDEDSDECTKQEFLKPYIKPYTGASPSTTRTSPRTCPRATARASALTAWTAMPSRRSPRWCALRTPTATTTAPPCTSTTSLPGCPLATSTRNAPPV